MPKECECGENCPTCEGCGEPMCECNCDTTEDEDEEETEDDF